MRVLVDTSVWVDFFNDHDSPEAHTLSVLIEQEASLVTCGAVMAEFFQGLTREPTIHTLESYFRDFELARVREPESWLRAAEAFRALRSRGLTIRSMVDCLIATLAAEADALLLAKDRDMQTIIASGVLPLRAAPLVLSRPR